MIVIEVENPKEYMSLRDISSVSGISLSSFYYKERSVIRLSPQIEYDIIRVASERPTYGYRRVWAVIRNNGIRVNRKAGQESPQGNESLLTILQT